MLVLREKAVSGIILTLLLIGMLTFAFNIQPVKASGTIYIRADGSVEGTDKIQRDGNLYTFTNSIETDSIIIEKDGIVIEGNGYILNSTVGMRGFDISYRKNVTIRNTRIMKFNDGVYVYHSNSCKILNNIVTDCWYAIDVMHSSNNNTVSGNFVNNSYGGISIDYSSDDNTVTNNTVTNSKYEGWGLYIWMSKFNEYSNNTVINCAKGIYVSQSAVNNTIHHNRFINNTNYGFDVSYSHNNTISDNILIGNYYGIHTFNSANNTVNSNIVSNSYSGIVFSYSGNNVLTGNNVSLNDNYYGGRGICLYNSNSNSIANNTASNNYYGIYLEYSNENVFSSNLVSLNSWSGIQFYQSNSNTILGNNITNNWVGIGLAGSSNNSICENNITTNNCGIYFSHSSNNVISGNIITNNTYQGIELYENSLNNSIFGNTVINSQYGIWLHHYSDYNYIAKNTVTNNTVGIRLSESVSHNRISGNDILANSFGIGFWAFADDNMIYHNNFIDNAQHIEYASLNVWDDGYPSGGNYWSDYTGVDANGDGIGDTPYVIGTDNQDRYPLMHPWSSLPVHNINTGLGYATIQEAINANETLNGHTILVETGTYYEHVVVNKSISLMGEDKSHTVIDGNGAGKVVLITANNASISGFAIRYSGYGVYDAGIWITSNSNNISNNHISNNSWGISLEYATLNIIKDNVIDGSWHSEGSWGGGIILWSGSNNNLILNNVISCREDNGIFLQGNENQIIGNTIMNYYFSAIHFDSNGNILYHNNFMEKEIYIIWIAGAHIWDNGYPSGGNYWSDYAGADVKKGPGQDLPGSDGIGDTPYVIDANNTDHYPLMNPYGAPPPPTYSLTITPTVDGITDPALGTYSYTANSTVQVTATPNAGYLFEYWELDSVNVDSANPYTVLMDKNHTLKAVFSPIPPPLSASTSPLSASILVGQSVTFTSTVSGGYTPYGYQWYLNGDPVSGANLTSWAFTPTTSGIYYVHLKVTDAKTNTAQSDTARITVATVPVGGYSIPIQLPTTAKPLTTHIALLIILTAIFITIKRKAKRKHKNTTF